MSSKAKKTGIVATLVAAAVLGGLPILGSSAEQTAANSLGMQMIRIEPGSFVMGTDKPLPRDLLPPIDSARGGLMDYLEKGDWDEQPSHRVTISQPFYMAAREVTNAQYEQFDPEHRKLRGKFGMSNGDDEAVVYVDWNQAQSFCRWLSKKEGPTYRLPTEAEWEYACRAGTATPYSFGDRLPEGFQKNPSGAGMPQKDISLAVGKTPPNRFGLYDMHGNVEEWVHDWYGPYTAADQRDPVGYADGDYRVTRGGSFGVWPYYLRSANRLGMLPEDKHWLVGFRVVMADLPKTRPLPPLPPPSNQKGMEQRLPSEVNKGPDPNTPYFRGPRKYVKIPTEASGPLFSAHNHDPAITECQNGDLLAVWYTCVSEKDRELGQAASRLRFGSDAWEPASPFFDVPDRNDHAPALWYDGKDTIYHFFGLSHGPTYGPLALALRTSKDSGASWSKARLIVPEHDRALQLQPSEPVFRLKDGAIVLAKDGRHTLVISRDEGKTWRLAAGTVPGTHPGAVELKDGRLLAFSRGGDISNRMPVCLSGDVGETWDCRASEFEPIAGGQRLVLMRLKEGPLFFASFAKQPFAVTDSTGRQKMVQGVFAAVSLDEGKTWPHRRLVTDDRTGHPVECTDGGVITLSGNSAEFRGYMAAAQAQNGLIHLITSRQEYAFNLKWIMTPPPPSALPVRVRREVETFSGPKFDLSDWADYKTYTGGFNGVGQYTINSRGHFMGLNRIAGEGSFEATFAVHNLRINPAPRPGPGLTLGFKDKLNSTVSVIVKENELSLSLSDSFGKSRIPKIRPVATREPVKAAKVRFVYNESTLQWRIFYGLNGTEPVTEFEESQEGIYFATPMTESTAATLLMSNGSVDLDHYEIRPLKQ